MGSNVDLTTRVFQLIREKDLLQLEVDNLRQRFARLTPEGQRQAVNYEAVLLLVLIQLGVDTVSVTVDQLEAMPQDRTLVLDGGLDGQTLRVRVVEKDADELHPERSN